MHYFIEHTSLTQQNSSDTFGVDSTDPTIKFNITSKFQLTSQAKAFSCQDGMMIVQQSDIDATLVNVIIKPIENLKIAFTNIKYFVYRGILKSNFFSGTSITPEITTNTEFIARLWQDFNNYKTQTNQPTLPPPTPKNIGYNNSLSASIGIEGIYDNSQSDTQALFIKQGEWFGDFATTHKIGFEIIIESGRITIDLAYLRKEKHQIDVTGLAGLELRAKREEILAFIDPAAFFGLHYENGVDVSTYPTGQKATETKKEDDLFILLLDKFSTKNRVYIDIRSELGYSYNFYQNYYDGSNNIKIGNNSISPIAQNYSTNNWPLLYVDTQINTINNFNDIFINLRIDDNLKPILFIDNADVLISGSRSKFIDDTKLLDGTSTDWSKEIKLKFPNTGTGATKSNVAFYIKLQYFRQEYNPASPNTTIKNEMTFDAIFGSIDMPYIGDTSYAFQKSNNSHLSFVKGQLSAGQNFSYTAYSGAHFDANRIVMYAQMAYPYKNSGDFYPDTKIGFGNGIDLDGNFNQLSFLKKNIYHSKQNIQEEISTNTYNSIDILDISNYNGFPSSKENLFILGLMQSELTSLKSVTGLSTQHNRYIVFEDVSLTPPEDKDGKPFKKYKLKIQGLDNNGNALIVTPTTDVFVYTNRDFMLCSKDFSETEPQGISSTYERNYEEKIGFENRQDTSVNGESITNKRYEDWFIEKDNGMKIEVDGFINALSQIANDANFYSNVKTLVEDSAADIWNQAVVTVQANSNANPDDRPLYWARIKMQVTLKSHPYFNGGINNVDLETLIKIFEEKSRNYTGIDFSNAPTGAKKILITGFDPFFLNEKHYLYGNFSNIRQSNPSGCSALALHNTLTQNGIGFIQTMNVPVRYYDFENAGQGKGVIEDYIEDWLDEVDMIITISQALPNDYNIDVFATATRGGLIDNLSHTRVEGSKSVYNPAPETIVTTLPDEFTQSPSQAVFNGKYFKTKLDYSNNVFLISTKSNYPNSKIFRGPGGNYLSNEIFYRVAKLRKEWIKSKLPTVVTKSTGHFHIAKLQDESVKEDFSVSETQTLLNIIKTTINKGVTGI